MSNYRKSSMFPKALAGCVEPLIRPVLKAQGLAGSRILSEWQSIVGPKLAAHCLPEKLSFPPGKKSNGTLTIAVESGFAPEVQHMQPMIIEKLATYFGYQAVTRITISHGYSKPAVAATLPPVKTVAGLSEKTKQLVDSLEDGELKDALRAMAESLSS